MKTVDLLELDGRMDFFTDRLDRFSDSLIRNGLIPRLPVLGRARVPGEKPLPTHCESRAVGSGVSVPADNATENDAAGNRVRTGGAPAGGESGGDQPPAANAAARGPAQLLVWGWALVRRAAALGVESLDVTYVEVDDAAALMLALELESRKGEYSWSEQNAVVGFLEGLEARNQCDGAAWETASALMRADGGLRDLVGRYRTLGPSIRGMVEAESISLKTALRLPPFCDALAGSHRAELGAMSYSVRRQFLEMLADLALVSANSEDALAAAATALDSRDALAVLRGSRYPMLTELESRFAEISHRAVGGTGLRIEPPPYFEGDNVSVSFRFRDRKELDARLEGLRRLRDVSDELLGLL